jgi:hypothetical protein
MAGENFVLGKDCKLYFGDVPLDGVTETAATMDWTELDNALDVNLNLSTGEADITTRANNGWKATAATLKEGSIEFEMLWKPTDAGFAAIIAAWLAGSEIPIAALDGAITVEGKKGLVSNCSVTNFSRSEPLEEAVKASVTLKPSSFTEWYVVPEPEA